MRAAVLTLLFCAPFCSMERAAAEDARVELRTHAEIQGLRVADMNGDGTEDLLVLEGRSLNLFLGRSGRLPATEPAWRGELRPGATFLDVVHRLRPGAPTLWTFGTGGCFETPLTTEAEPRSVAGGHPLSWRDVKKATFAELLRGDGILLPRRDGWTYRPAGSEAAIQLQLTPKHSVRAPGPFLEDKCAITIALPDAIVGRPAFPDAGERAVALWSIDGEQIVSQSIRGSVRYDLAFLSADLHGGDVDQQLVDLDGDGRPELLHRIFSNRDSRYGFFRTRPTTAADARVGPTHKPAVSDMKLSGFQLDPEFHDLDGDGLKDLVITSIQVDGANTLRALSTGRVTAETRAFLNRWGRGGKTYFRDEADAVIKSDVVVRIRFNYAGTVEVERSFTILLDGDFNGDGRKDLAIRTSKGEMTIRLGVAAGVWEPEGRKVPIPPMGDHPDVDGDVADVDGDGRDEIVLHYHQPLAGRDRLWVLRTGP